MTEILTESFCERCGTRYTFESARPKTRLKGVQVLSRGLKNYVLSDNTSIDEAMAAARSETDREATAHQLDAFHKTFNFCMSCRQYTCPNCWNEPEARCLSCAPLELPEPPVRLEDLGAFGAVGLVGDTPARNGTPHVHEHDGWPEAIEATADTPEGAFAPDVADGRDETAPAQPEPVSFAPDAGATIEPEPIEAAPDDTAPESIAADAVDEESSVEVDPARKAAAQTMGLLRRFRPGQNLDAELEAYERERSQTAEAVPVVPEPAAEPEPQPEPAAAASPADVVEQPTWRITAPDSGGATRLPPTSEPDGQIPLQASASQPATEGAEPQWPARPQWPGATSAGGLPFLGRPAAGQGGIEALWAASNEELVTAAPTPGRAAASGIQPCVSCGLSLSATARFCRRCGTLQGR
jgi:hypothetical protein